MTSTRPDLPVPDEAMAAFIRYGGAHADTIGLARIREIAAPVVAAVLREEADRIAHAYHLSGPTLAARLRERATQISGEPPREV